MSKLGLDEEKIHDIFSQISVDSSKLAKEVRTKLHRLDANGQVRKHKPLIRSSLVVTALLIFLVGSGTAAVLGNFEWFMKRFNPNFVEIIEPIEAHMEDQGIRMEIIGAQKYDNRAVVYLSLQDTTGKNRLTERTAFKDGFNVKTSRRNKDIGGKSKDYLLSSLSWKEKMVYFDEVTNTIYYEFNISTDLDRPFSEKLELGSSLIYFDNVDFREEPINLSLEEIKVKDAMPINGKKIWGGRNIGDNKEIYKDILIPGNYASLPHGQEDQWISNIGIIDGKLHVQVGKIFNKEFGVSDANIDLKDEKGNIISCDYSLVLLGDEKNNILDLEKHDYGDALYRYEEFVFPIKSDMINKYSLFYTGSVSSGLEGNWKLATSLGDSRKDILTWTDGIIIEGHNFEYITLSPLGLNAMGSYGGKDSYASDMIVEIETIDGIIKLDFNGGSQEGENQRFNSSWSRETPIDIERVTAIIINDTHIPIK